MKSFTRIGSEILNKVQFFLLLFPLSIFSNSFVKHVYLTWMSEDTSTTITINVHAYDNLKQIHICYDTESHAGKSDKYRFHIVKKGKSFLEDLDPRWLFHVELTDLQPGKTYYFIVGDPISGYTEEKKFRTIPIGENYLFIEGGDWELTEEAAQISQRAAQENPHALLLGGDYPREVHTRGDYSIWDKWLDMMEKSLLTPDGHIIPMVLAIGNHEVIGGFDRKAKDVLFFLDYFPQGPKRRTYFVRHFGKDIVLIVLDSGHTKRHYGKQLAWLKEILEKHKNFPILFATYHVPIYPSVRFAKKDRSFRTFKQILQLTNKDTPPERLLSPQSALGKKYWLPLFDRYKLTAAFEHHDQTMKRTKFLRCGEEDPNGTLFLGDGGWGPLIQCIPIQAYFRNCFAKVIGHKSFYWKIQVAKETITYTAISKEGKTIDCCVQNRRKSCQD